MSKNANGEGSIYKWVKDGKPSGYKGALSYKDENDVTKSGMWRMGAPVRK